MWPALANGMASIKGLLDLTHSRRILRILGCYVVTILGFAVLYYLVFLGRASDFSFNADVLAAQYSRAKDGLTAQLRELRQQQGLLGTILEYMADSNHLTEPTVRTGDVPGNRVVVTLNAGPYRLEFSIYREELIDPFDHSRVHRTVYISDRQGTPLTAYSA